MKSNQFWSQVNTRITENQQIVQGGTSPKLARFASWLGLRFWFINFWLSLTITLYLWLLFRPTLLIIVRHLVWR